MNVRQIEMRFEKEDLKAFLASHSLRLEEDVETAFGLFDEDDTLCGCGCAAGGLLKCFAVDGSLRGQNALGTLVSALIQDRFSKGITRLFVITRAKNEAQFTACGFCTVAKTDALVMLENRKNGPELFMQRFASPCEEGKCIGSAVMNCNPFTLGHRRLIEYAAAHCDVLHVFVVEENRSLVPAADRLMLVKEGTADIQNVRVHLSGPYMISSATFPTYFIKKEEDAVTLQCELDASLFAQRIAPCLHITRRFLGEEPLDPVTAAYNRVLSRVLPEAGVEVCVIPRLAMDGAPVSASRVRALMKSEETFEAALAYLPACTQAYVLSHKELFLC